MVEIIESATFRNWIIHLRDRQARARINVRIRRLSLGNPGQCRVLDGGVCELKVDHGPGYRVYFTQRGPVVVVLLCGGDKSTQATDIEQAKRIAREWVEPS